MPSTKPQIKAVIEQEDYEKFKKITESENRTISNLLQTIVKKYISDYETEHGMINISESGDSSNLPGGGHKMI